MTSNISYGTKQVVWPNLTLVGDWQHHMAKGKPVKVIIWEEIKNCQSFSNHSQRLPKSFETPVFSICYYF